MARPRRTAPTAHILFKQPILPKLPSGTWPALESIIEVKFRPTARCAIRKALERYIENKYLDTAGAERAKLRGRKGADGRDRETSAFMRLEHALFACVEAWNRADSDPAAAIAVLDASDEIEAKSHGIIQPETLRLHLEWFADELLSWRVREIEDNGKSLPDPFDGFVSEVAAIIDKAGGRVTTHGRSYEIAAKLSAFQLFMRHLHDLLPLPAKDPIHSGEAFASKVTKARSRRS